MCKDSRERVPKTPWMRPDKCDQKTGLGLGGSQEFTAEVSRGFQTSNFLGFYNLHME